MNKLFLMGLLLLSQLSYANLPAQNLNLTVTGTVVPYCYFSVNSVVSTTGAGSSTSVTIQLTSPSETPGAAAVALACNDPFGYIMTATSQNNGILKGTAGGQIAYKLNLDSNSATQLSSSNPTQILAKSSLATPELASHPMTISYPNGTNALADTYSDTILLTLTGQ